MQSTQLCVSKFEYLNLKWLRYVVAFLCHCIPFVIIQDRFILCSQISHKKHPTIYPAQYWTLLKWTSFWSTILHFFPNWVRSWRSPNLDAFNISPIWYNTKCFCSLESSIMSKFLILDSLHSTLNNKVWPVGKIPLISLKDVQKLTYSFPKIASKWKLKKNNNNNNKEKRSTDSKTFHDINDKYRSGRVLIQRSKFFHDEIDDAQRYKLWLSYIQIFCTFVWYFQTWINAWLTRTL